MRKDPHPIVLFIGFLAPILTMSYIFIYGVDKFVLNFPGTSCLWISAVIFGSIMIYYVQLTVIKRKRKISGHEMPKDEIDFIDFDSDEKVSDLLSAYCSSCKKDGFYIIDDMTKPHLWVCWNCREESSTVWCDVCGMGGDFVKKISSKPLSWKCPECKTKYTLPENFYDTLFHSQSWENTSLDVRRKYFNMQRKFQIDQMGRSIYFIGTLALSWAWTTGLMKVVEKEIFNSFFLFGIYMASFIGMWYGMIVYSKYGYQLYKRLKATL